MSEKKKKPDIKEITSLLKKVQADFENSQKRAEKEKKDYIEYSCQNIIIELLPILDSFDLALKNTDSKDIKALYDQLWNLLSSKGLEKIKALDEKFDPFLHEALLQEASDKPEGTVIEELQAGYKLKEIIIRHTKVKVAKK
jgi:molecular chaperone GrpE